MTKALTRTCTACRIKQQKPQLIRVCRNKNGGFFVDESGKGEGRGAYVCISAECINKCVTKKLLNKSFKCAVDDAVYKMLAETANKKEKQ
jgi:hypothetical protein